MAYPKKETKNDKSGTCTDVMDPFVVVVMRSWSAPKSVAKVGW